MYFVPTDPKRNDHDDTTLWQQQQQRLENVERELQNLKEQRLIDQKLIHYVPNQENTLSNDKKPLMKSYTST